MESTKELCGYNKGYADGYRAGLADGLAGKHPGDIPPETLALPIAFLELSTRARNCLAARGCESIADVANLSESRIFRMRGLGKGSADEIARALREKGICHTAWDRYLLD